MDKKSTFLVVYFAGKLSEDRARHIFDIVSHTLVVAHEEQFPYLLQPFSSPATYDRLSDFQSYQLDYVAFYLEINARAPNGFKVGQFS